MRAGTVFWAWLAVVAACGRADAAASVEVTCPEPGGWTVTSSVRTVEPGVSMVRITARADAESAPPAFKAVIKFPQLDCTNAWNPNFGCAETLCPLPWWGSMYGIARTQPLNCHFNGEDVNRMTIAAGEIRRELKMRSWLREEDFCIYQEVEYFPEAAEPLREYVTEIRLDERPVSFADAIRAAAAWQAEQAGVTAARCPAAAFEPVYSTWYNFHKDVTATAVEDECRRAAELGMKVVILDDGWQCDDIERSYKSCGDWRISRTRFPDMRAHVERVHQLGMKYMVWFSMPYIGEDTEAWRRLKGKTVRYVQHSQAWVLDPRFPEVREYLRDVYVRCLVDWNIDGFKFDFVDAIGLEGEPDPAAAQGYAGRDCRSLSEGVDRLLREVTEALGKINGDLLYEFRQSYVGAAIRRYGNMVRVGDCPGSLVRNRVHIADLRLLCPGTSVHSDMLRWHDDETPEAAARFILNSMFGTVQYSVTLSRAPERVARMIRHWIGFLRDHRQTLLQGEFRPHRPALNYPVIEAESETERIVTIYDSMAAFELGPVTKPTYVVNATGGTLAGLKLPADANVQAFDTCGDEVEGGLPPPSGYLRLTPAAKKEQGK